MENGNNGFVLSEELTALREQVKRIIRDEIIPIEDRLDPDAPEFRKGFLLNHLISELLPSDGGYHYANADPITGQAAWYDLRVRIDRVGSGEAGTTAPSFKILEHPASLSRPPGILRYFAGTDREGLSPKGSSR